MMRTTLIAKEKLISLSVTAFKSTGLIPPSQDIFHSTCYISALAKASLGGYPAAPLRANPREALPESEHQELPLVAFYLFRLGFLISLFSTQCQTKPRRQTPTNSLPLIKVLIT